MKLVLILSLMLGAFWTHAETISTQSLFEGTTSDQTLQVAKKKRKKRRKRRKRKPKAYVNNAAAVSRVYSQKGVKLGAGLVFADGANPFVLGADYIHPFREKMAFVAGGSFWTHSESGSTLTAIHIDGGLGYHILMGKKLDIELGGRGGMTRVSISNSVGSGSETWLTLTPYAAVNYLLSSSAIGAEVRKPFYLSGSSVSSFDAFYLMGFYRFFF
ncbi:MAG: hypothetical protein KDD61_11350 [Bdellovibrionales bacterium]|nr:hypothetical protein [Bdellovibrionales bacterium]